MTGKESPNEENPIMLCRHGCELLLAHALATKLDLNLFMDILEKSQQVKNAFLSIVNMLFHEEAKFDSFLEEYKETQNNILQYLDFLKDAIEHKKDISDLH